jgi:hypothetical protein
MAKVQISTKCCSFFENNWTGRQLTCSYTFENYSEMLTGGGINSFFQNSQKYNRLVGMDLQEEKFGKLEN